MAGARTVPVEQRNAELEEQLRKMLDALERGSPPPGNALTTWVRYGARVAASRSSYGRKEAIYPFLFDPREENGDQRGSPPAQVTIHPAALEKRLARYDEAFEDLWPGRDWPELHRALFWRLLARVHQGRSSDYVLNLRADALGRAAPWHLEHEPQVAMMLLVERARVLLAASYGEAEISPPLEAALAVWKRGALRARMECDFILQACEVLEGLRRWWSGILPKTQALLALAARGLALCHPVAQPPQRARLYSAAADALFHGADLAQLDGYSRAAVFAELGQQPPDALAETAWRRALELEGDEQGEARNQERLQQYRAGLALLALRRGEVDEAIAILEGQVPDSTYSRMLQNKRILGLLRQRRIDRERRLAFVERILRREVLEPALDHEDAADRALEVLRFGLYQFADLGAGPERAPFIEQLRSRQGIAEALERRQQKSFDEQFLRMARARPPRPARPPPTPAQLEEWRAKMLARETPQERTERLVYGAASDVLEAAHAQLLIQARVLDRGSRCVLLIYVHSPETAFEVVKGDPAVAAVLRAIEERVWEAVPGAPVEITLTHLSLAREPGDFDWLAPALTYAGATTALTALGLDPQPPADVDEALRRNEERRTEAAFHT